MMYEFLQYVTDKGENVCLPIDERTVQLCIDLQGMPAQQRKSLGFLTDDPLVLEVVFFSLDGQAPLIRISHDAVVGSNRVIEHLKKVASRLADDTFDPKDRTFLWRLFRHVQASLHVFTERCVVCNKQLPAPGLKPIPCDDPKCAFAFDELGVGSGLDEIRVSPQTADLLILLTAAAVESDDVRKASMFTTVPNDFADRRASGLWTAHWELIKRAISQIPSVSDMQRLDDGAIRAMIGDPAFKLMRWIFSTNRAVLNVISEADQMTQMRTPHQYAVIVDSVLKANRFQTLKSHRGSFYAFHGSGLGNWHAILRAGLRNFSNTSMMSTGAVMGSGIYLALNAATSAAYCRYQNSSWSKSSISGNVQCIALCEVIGKPPASGVAVIPDEEHVSVRFLFLYSGQSIPYVSAEDLAKTPIVCANESLRQQMAANSATFDESNNILNSCVVNPTNSGIAFDDSQSCYTSDEEDSSLFEDSSDQDFSTEFAQEETQVTVDHFSNLMDTSATMSRGAQLRLVKELREMSHSAEWHVDIVDDNLLTWDVKMRLEEGSLAQDLKKYAILHGQDFIHLRLEFPEDYPNDPPFVFLHSPVMEYGTAFVSHGAICTTLLLNTGTSAGWSPAYTVESVLVSIKANFQDPMAKGHIRQIDRPLKYTRSQALEGWNLTKQRHGW